MLDKSWYSKVAKQVIIAKNSGTGEDITIEVDAIISENQSYSNSITKFPIESGSFINDNVVRNPEKITLVGFVTNYPISIFGSLSNPLSGRNVFDNALKTQTAYENLLRISGRTRPVQFDTEQPDWSLTNSIFLCTLYTTHRIYTDMFLETLSIPKDSNSGDSLEFTAEFVKVVFVDSLLKKQNNSKDVPSANRTQKQAAPKTPPVKTPTKSPGVLQSVLKKGLNIFIK